MSDTGTKLANKGIKKKKTTSDTYTHTHKGLSWLDIKKDSQLKLRVKFHEYATTLVR